MGVEASGIYQPRYWVTVGGMGTVYQSESDEQAEAMFNYWCGHQDKEVILFADGDVWKRH